MVNRKIDCNDSYMIKFLTNKLTSTIIFKKAELISRSI